MIEPRDPYEPIPVEGELPEEEVELFGSYRALIPISVEGERCPVPEGTSVLRALQYAELKHELVKMDWRRYCWNDTDGCCEMEYRIAGEERVRIGLACRLAVRARLEIVRLPKGGRRCR
jgi:hypothetical protein